MKYFIKGHYDSPFNSLRASKIIPELPHSFVGISNKGQSIYVVRLMIREIYDSEFGHLNDEELSAQTLMERKSWCHRQMIKLYNKTKPLGDEDDEVLILDPRDDLSDLIECVPNGTEVELNEYMIFRRH